MATFFYPIELTNPALPIERRFFFIEVEALDAYEAHLAGTNEAEAMLGVRGGGSTSRIGYARWWPQAECPTIAEMIELRKGMDKARYGLARGRAEQSADQRALVHA